MACLAVIVAHPDDAELAAGGTIARMVEEGHRVVIFTMTVSEPRSELRDLRREAALRAAQQLGAELIWAYDGRLDQVEELPMFRLVGLLDEFAEEFKPSMVLTHWEGDSHHDHVLLARAMRSASRRWSGTLLAFGNNEFRAPAVASFQPNTFIDISRFMERKLEAIGHYRYEGQSFRELKSEAVKTIAQNHGLPHGFAYAEAFQVQRQFFLGEARIA